jgi:hypothetical protein
MSDLRDLESVLARDLAALDEEDASLQKGSVGGSAAPARTFTVGAEDEDIVEDIIVKPSFQRKKARPHLFNIPIHAMAGRSSIYHVPSRCFLLLSSPACAY